MHYYVVGVNGTGKTTLLKAISDRTGIEAIHGTTKLMDDLQIPGDYFALRAMDQDDVLMKWAETASKLVEGYDYKPFLLDTHILNLRDGEIIRRDGDWIAMYDALILVKGDPSVILSRIEKDSNKDRALFSIATSDSRKIEIISYYQNETEKLFHLLCDKYSLPSLIIENNNSIDQGVDAFINSDLYPGGSQ